jgi:hypothetical protein
MLPATGYDQISHCIMRLRVPLDGKGREVAKSITQYASRCSLRRGNLRPETYQLQINSHPETRSP